MALALVLGGCSPSDDVGGRTFDPTPAPSVGGLRWSVPGRWVERSATGMRAAAYEVPDASGGTPALCSVFYFGQGRAGTMDANLERWRGQFSRVEHADTAGRVVGGLALTVVEIEGSFAPTSSEADLIDDALLLGAAVDGPQGPVFVKCVGRRAALEPARSEFVALLASISAR